MREGLCNKLSHRANQLSDNCNDNGRRFNNLKYPKKTVMLEELKELMMGQVAEVELVYRSKIKPSQRPLIREPGDSYKLFMMAWHDGKIALLEEFKVIFLNRANRVIGIMNLSSGGITSTVVDPRLILVSAIKLPACNIIVAHNHPSGSLTPSFADEELTRKLKSACQLLDIRLLDHLILNEEGYFSFSEQGLI
jgi:DNA repair protein RadC